MSKIWSRLSAVFRNRTFIGADKAGNQYYIRTEQIDGIMKEKRWVEFKGEVDSTSIPVEWICWLNGQRKLAPTPEEMAILEARRQRVKENVALLKKEEEERKSREGGHRKITSMGKGDGPDLKSFIQQLPVASEGKGLIIAESPILDRAKLYVLTGFPTCPSCHLLTTNRSTKKQDEKEVNRQAKQEPESAEPSGSGASFRPGTWQPPT
ncbi:hypothetical protein SSX86_006815 [Deinandra increscens subsp. villosa]|uniref:NADH dehydrogenase [ubiquinone] 1 alpha subcomplex subunit 12 n=1 Tax=Deinandra increscens subsp. villosa TaxID=3103831 RepID=A0AAP0H456_9ASTR